MEGAGWVDAGDLQVGNPVRRSDGTLGEVESLETTQRPQVMYNLTVAEAHTFFVGNQRWLVHNKGCDFWSGKLTEYEKVALDKGGHLDAAKRELNGEIVKLRPDGTPYDHVTEVRQIQNGLLNMITDLQNQLNSANLSHSVSSEMQNLLSRASNALDYTEKYVPR